MPEAVLRGLAGGMKALGRSLTEAERRKQKEAEAVAKEEKTKRLAEEKDIEAAFSQIEGLKLLDSEIASMVGMYQLTQSQAGRPMKALDQFVIKGLFSQKEEIAEQEAAEAEERELAEALRQQPTAFGEPAGEMGYLEQDVSGMLMGRGMGELDPGLAALGLTPAQLETPTSRQEIGAGVGLIGRSIEDYLAQDETPTEGEFSTFLTERRERVEEREAVRAGELAGMTAKTRAKALGLTPSQIAARQREAERARKVEIQAERGRILTGATEKYQANVDIATRKKIGIMSIDNRADLERVLSKAGKADFWAKITKGVLGRGEPPDWWFDLHDALTEYNEVPTVFTATDRKGKPVEVTFDENDMSVIEEIMSARGL